ncbi:hypothetical protein CRG98_038189 [Punica granatum]|uniref:Uncharacterized protein n=1 Tax=Punica granatum TaxID=22663 RepID=A0A2I0IBP1_PUNGR|nr:hypothetical protein CRG98_038189 [Punica granatum]
MSDNDILNEDDANSAFTSSYPTMDRIREELRLVHCKGEGTGFHGEEALGVGKCLHEEGEGVVFDGDLARGGGGDVGIVLVEDIIIVDQVRCSGGGGSNG